MMKRPLFALGLIFAITQEGLAQYCNPAMIPTAPNNRYVMNNNGTVLDKKTGLTWKRCLQGQTWKRPLCLGVPNYMSWQAALLDAESAVFAGQQDWRLPNQKELQSLVESSCDNPSINLTAFPNADTERVWSSSPVPYHYPHLQNAKFVHFGSGYSFRGEVTNGNQARLVRGGQ